MVDTAPAQEFNPSLQLECPHLRIGGSGRFVFPELDAASDSCRLCCLYKDVALACIRGQLPGLSEPFFKDEADEKAVLDELRLSYNHGDLTLHAPGHDYSLVILRDTDLAGPEDAEVEGRNFERRYRVGRYTNSGESFERARKWLNDCLSSHSCPKLGVTEVSLPKRLLAVDGAPESPIRLVETKGDEYPYVCLSHRWGDPKHKQLKTTTRTVQSHMDKVEWHELPATFRDAVTVCRSMDIKYLWIDSLCIFQSFEDMTSEELEVTKQDFAQENSNMARTYRNSHFTISADISTHMDSGMFSRYPVDDYNMNVISDDGNQASIYVREWKFNHYGDKVPELETRGWTLQEFLLPLRVLHLGVFDLEWRCAERITCGCGVLDRDERQQSNWHRHHFIEKATKPPPDDPEGALVWWEQVISSYTSRQLTNAADKLPALSGMAQQRTQVRGGVYLAGLWQDSLLHDLCWYHAFMNNVPEAGGVGLRPSQYRAPSWSWASLDTDAKCCWWWTGVYGRHPVSADGEPKPACEILEVACVPSTSDPTGAVRSGFLDIKAGLIPGEICPDPEERVTWSVHNLETLLNLRFFKPDCTVEDDDLTFGSRVFCAPIAEVVHPTGLQYGCLVLKAVDTITYQRIGFCVLRAGTMPSRVRSGSAFRSRQNRLARPFNLEDYILPKNSRVQIRII
ncbi:hypothetical protein FIE12Z_3615 [Fusarium flagelliforme]|uniref:Heterokaryon incompatibility domain-containing protein n=1 Tax=Fusarium flagelliforme TaxID=2675880 RepID=A0A395MX78_9HYPO|nr:hypothetical protein FIE12Z_3615 [Fusarium flagelliforme]